MRGLIVGRFQPFHRGHLALLEAVRARRPDEELLLGIGSAQSSYTFDNPFTAGERFEMISLALREAGIGSAAVLPVPDIDRHALWVSHVVALCPAFQTVYSNNPLTELLFRRAGFEVVSVPLAQRARWEGRSIRQRMADGGSWAEDVPPAVAEYLRSIDGQGRLRMLSARASDRSAAP